MSSELRNRWEHAGGRIPEEWEIVSLENLLLDSKSITVGVMYPGADTIGGVPLIKVGDIKQGYIPNKPSYCISAETNHEHKRSQLQGEELLITLVGNPGECVVVTPHMIGWNPARAIATVRLKDSTLRVYLKTVLESAAGKHMIDAVLNTTVQKTLNLKDIKQLPIPMPPSATIKALSEFSQALSDRITLLRETNATLEAIAQALFKSWFVDFDPVHAKQQGRLPEGMDEQTAALFPDSFEESVVGLVPLGWAVGTLADYANLHKGSKNPLHYAGIEFEHYSLPAFDSGQMPIFEMADEIKSNKTTVPSNAVLLSKLNPHIPRVWMPTNSGKNAVCSTEFLVFTPVGSASSEFIYCSFTTPMFHHLLCQLVTGTSNSHQRVKAEGVLGTPSIIPSSETSDKFAEITRPIFKRIGHNRNKIQTLADLRDTLLPRLISGQLRVGI